MPKKRKFKIWYDSKPVPEWPWHLLTPEGVICMRYATFEEAISEMNSAIKGEGLPSLMY